MAQVHQATQGFTYAECDDILARVAVDEDLVQQLQAGEKYSEKDLPMKLVELVNQRKKLFAQQRAEAKRNKPMTLAQQKAYMSTYIKNQEGGDIVGRFWNGLPRMGRAEMVDQARFAWGFLSVFGNANSDRVAITSRTGSYPDTRLRQYELTVRKYRTGLWKDLVFRGIRMGTPTQYLCDYWSGWVRLPSNTVASSRGDLKAITTRSGGFYDGPTIPATSSPLSKEVEREPEATKDKPGVAPKPNIKPSMPYLSRLNDQKLREKANNQMLKFLQIFQRLHFDLSFADALLHMPKFASTFKSLFSNKEKLFELANTPLNKNCLAVLLKKLPEKLGNLDRFLIPCDFLELDKCLALADLGASINLIPLSIWKKLSLPELTPTSITLELANRSVAYPVGVAEDVIVKVGKFHFPSDFVVVDYDVDPRVPLILGRPFLRTIQALVDHANESINMIIFIDITCEDRFPEVLKLKKSNHPSSGNTTPHSNYSLLDYDAFFFDDDHIEEKSSGSTTTHSDFSLLEYDSFIFNLSIDSFPFADKSAFYHEEFVDELTLLDPFPPGNEDDNFDPEVDLRKI
ncbi:reverse transcriptase domain-containing protein [Tanacetum coccineum]